MSLVGTSLFFGRPGFFAGTQTVIFFEASWFELVFFRPLFVVPGMAIAIAEVSLDRMDCLVYRIYRFATSTEHMNDPCIIY